MLKHKEFSPQRSWQSGNIILLIVCILTGIGLVMIFSSSAMFADRYWNEWPRFLIRQIIYLTVATGALLIGVFYPYKNYKKHIGLLMVFTFCLMLIVVIPGIGTKVSGGRRWIRLAGVGFQPVELLKFTLILWVAGFLDRKKDVLARFSRGLLPSFIVMGIYLFLLMLQPDFGNTVLLSLTLLLMTFVAGVKPSHMMSSLTGIVIVGFFLVVNSPYRMRRITAFLDPWADPLDKGYQLIRSFISYGTGGWFGKGIGSTLQKTTSLMLPQAHTDFIFSVIAEETGLFGVTIVLGLFCAFMFKGYQIARDCNDDFGQNLAFGITTMIILQALIHICVVTGLLPTKGIGLPFISYGGSSLLMTFFMTGVLVNISKSRASTPKSDKRVA